jgi:Rrf2 family transcriptional regulator, iron-sulfur cluster assembly transcription factor
MNNISRDRNMATHLEPATTRRTQVDPDPPQAKARSPHPSDRWDANSRPQDSGKVGGSFRSAKKAESRPALMIFTRLFIATVDAMLQLPAPGEDGVVRRANAFAREGDLRRLLEPTLQKLVKRGVLRSVRGPRGGYALGKPRSAITLANLLDATITEKRLERGKIIPISPLGRLVDSQLSDLETKWSRNLAEITLEDLYAKAKQTTPE